jgi:hypothetical protein
MASRDGHGGADDLRPDRRHLHLLQDVTFDPVFIIGDHRSGTTVLYQLLASTGAFNVVTAHDVIHYHRILDDHLAQRTADTRKVLARRFGALGLANRGIDGVAVTPDLPEEYGFVIDHSGRPRLSPRTRPALIELCRKVRFIGGDRPVLLKNPWDVLTFAYVKTAFPSARLIFVHRHPMKVMSSQLSAMRVLMDRKNEYVSMLSAQYRKVYGSPLLRSLQRALTGRRFRIGARLVGYHVKKVARYYLRHVDDMPPGDIVELRYEDMCAEADATLERLLAFLGVRNRADAPARGLLQPRGGTVLPDVLEEYRRIRPALASYCARLGYERD